MNKKPIYTLSQNQGKAKAIIIILLFLLISGGIAIAVIFYLNHDKDQITKKPLSNIELREELYNFSYSQLPDIYLALLRFDNEIRLIDNELDRLADLENTFPKHKRIITSEKNEWVKLKKQLLITFTNFTKQIEVVCVQYKVNEEKGSELIQQQKEELLKTLDDAIESSKELTKRIKPPIVEKSYLQKLMEKFQ